MKFCAAALAKTAGRFASLVLPMPCQDAHERVDSGALRFDHLAVDGCRIGRSRHRVGSATGMSDIWPLVNDDGSNQGK